MVTFPIGHNYEGETLFLPLTLFINLDLDLLFTAEWISTFAAIAFRSFSIIIVISNFFLIRWT